MAWFAVFLSLFAAAWLGVALFLFKRWRDSSVGQARARVLAEIRPALTDLRQNLEWPHSLDRALDQACDSYASETREERLRAMPIESVKSRCDARVRWSALRAAGIVTVHDASGWSAVSLQRLDGIGETSARAVAHAVFSIRQVVESEPVAIPTALHSRHALRAVSAARQVLVCAEELGDLRRTADEVRAQLLALEVGVRKSTSVMAWLTRPSGRDEMEMVCGIAERRIATMQVREIVAAVAVANRRASDRLRVAPDLGTLDQEFHANYADYAALLDATLNRRVRGKDARLPSLAAGGLPLDVAGRVESQSLNLTGLKANLRPYQAFGVKYLVRQSRTILGDEMGLGKTLQAIAALVHVSTAEKATHFLVVAPGSVLINWQRELARFSALEVAPLTGPPQERHAKYQAWRRNGGVALTSYETLTSLAIDAVGLDHLIVDEAHFVKNPQAKRTQAVIRLLDDARRVTLMTGTPMENRPGEFIHLLGMVDPKRAADLRRHDSGIQLLTLANAEFRDAVAPVYLRRNQSDVLKELPDRIEVDEWIDLNGSDSTAYRDLASGGALMTLRWAVTIGAGVASTKIERMRELVDEHRDEGRKILVFSYFVRVLDVVEQSLGTVFRIDGGTSSGGRQSVLDAFGKAADGAVLLAQIDVGGVGLNIQAASVVILMEPQLKPSTESQAIARAHRMGQSKVVMVHRILARESIDERIVELLRRKTESFDAYARGSALKDASPMAQAVDAAPALEAELRRLGVA